MRIGDRVALRFGVLAMGAALLAACQTMPERDGFSTRQMRVLEAAGFRDVDGQYELGLENRILFEFDRSDLRPEVITMLRTLSGKLADVGIHGAQVEGHTDSEGAEDYNALLSLQRAEAVRLALATKGMNFDAIRTQGRGESDPVADNETAEGRQQNRRVVIVVTALDAAPL